MAFRSDDPPNSRLFILCQKGVTEKEFRDKFGVYGKIDDIWIVKDKRTNEDRGIVYVTFRKTSEAMLAMEEMNGRCMPGQPKPLKVVVANSKRDGSTRDPREDEKLVRLFIICPKAFTEKELREEFEKYGDLDHVTVIRDRGSGESKGFGYVKYHRPYHAALAYEKCNIIFKPKFAEPQRSRDERENSTDSFYNFSLNTTSTGFKNNKNTFEGESSMFSEPLPHIQMAGGCSGGVPGGIMGVSAGSVACSGNTDELGQSSSTVSNVNDSAVQCDCCELQVLAPIGMTRAYLAKLFSLVPGMEYCDLNETTGVAYAKYATPQCAAYAKDKLNSFEYPIGSPLLVQFANEYLTFSEPSLSSISCVSTGGGDDITDLRQKAASLLEQAGIDPQAVIATSSQPAGTTPVTMMSIAHGMERVNYCGIPLPLPQPLVPDTSLIVQRLFIVCQPSAVSERVLRDAFSRFGNLIDVFLLAGRNYGYAKYASKESAMKAIQTLHGQNLSGQRVKVLEAEPPKSGDSASAKKQTV